MPGDTIGNFGSALQLLSERASYLYADGDRFWFDLQVSLNRTVAERAAGFSAADVSHEVVERLKKQSKYTAVFPDVIFAPRDSADVPEAERVRLVVAGPEHTHDGKGKASPARDFAEDVVTKRGSAPRVNANTIVVLAPDEGRWLDLEQAVRQYLAWRGTDRDKVLLDLTQGQVAAVGKRIDTLNATVEQRIRETWIWTLYPEQTDGAQPLKIAAAKVDGASDSVIRTVAVRLAKTDVVIEYFSMQSISLELQNHLRSRWNSGRLPMGELWDFHVRFPYLARLRDKTVLTDAISGAMTDAAWEQIGFALADGYDAESGDFVGLRVPLEDTMTVITDSTLLVNSALARSQRDRETAARKATVDNARALGEDASGEEPKTAGPGSDAASAGAQEDTPSKPTHVVVQNARYSGVVDLKTDGDLGSQLLKVAEELLVHLQNASPDTFEVRLTIDADKRDGFSTATVRPVKENGTTLAFTKNGFSAL